MADYNLTAPFRHFSLPSSWWTDHPRSVVDGLERGNLVEIRQTRVKCGRKVHEAALNKRVLSK